MLESQRKRQHAAADQSKARRYRQTELTSLFHQTKAALVTSERGVLPGDSATQPDASGNSRHNQFTSSGQLLQQQQQHQHHHCQQHQWPQQQQQQQGQQAEQLQQPTAPLRWWKRPDDPVVAHVTYAGQHKPIPVKLSEFQPLGPFELVTNFLPKQLANSLLQRLLDEASTWEQGSWWFAGQQQAAPRSSVHYQLAEGTTPGAVIDAEPLDLATPACQSPAIAVSYATPRQLVGIAAGSSAAMTSVGAAAERSSDSSNAGVAAAANHAGSTCVATFQQRTLDRSTAALSDKKPHADVSVDHLSACPELQTTAGLVNKAVCARMGDPAHGRWQQQQRALDSHLMHKRGAGCSTGLALTTEKAGHEGQGLSSPPAAAAAAAAAAQPSAKQVVLGTSVRPAGTVSAGSVRTNSPALAGINVPTAAADWPPASQLATCSTAEKPLPVAAARSPLLLLSAAAVMHPDAAPGGAGDGGKDKSIVVQSTEGAASGWAAPPAVAGAVAAAHKQPGSWQASYALANLYTDGQQSVGTHTDRLSALGPLPTIASLSLGVTRVFRLHPANATVATAAAARLAAAGGTTGKGSSRAAATVSAARAAYCSSQSSAATGPSVGRVDIQLPHNSLLIMWPPTQEEWRHEVPKTKAVTPHPISGTARINLTFRQLRPAWADAVPSCRCGRKAVMKCKLQQGQYLYYYSCDNSRGPTCGLYKMAMRAGRIGEDV